MSTLFLLVAIKQLQKSHEHISFNESSWCGSDQCALKLCPVDLTVVVLLVKNKYKYIKVLSGNPAPVQFYI